MAAAVQHLRAFVTYRAFGLAAELRRRRRGTDLRGEDAVAELHAGGHVPGANFFVARYHARTSHAPVIRLDITKLRSASAHRAVDYFLHPCMAVRIRHH